MRSASRWFAGFIGCALVLLVAAATVSERSAPARASFPGGNGQIAFVRNLGGPNGYEIFVSDADGSSVIQLTNNSVNDFAPAWSPDGAKIAYSEAGDIWVMDADGSDQVQLTYDSQTDSDPVWSPDSTKIAFNRGTQIYTMKADGTEILQRTTIGNNTKPDWSPDGARIVFNSDRDGNWEIYVMETHGAYQQNLSMSAVFDAFPKWSPDGTHIAFESGDSSDSADIYVIAADGTGLTRLTSEPPSNGPAFSPDGTKIMFSRFGQELVVMDSDGTNVMSLGISGSAPDWQPLGSSIPPPVPCSDMDGDSVCDDYDSELDGDGCPNLDEQMTHIPSELYGGRRNLLNPHDYFNPSHDGQNRVDDILLVVNQYFDDDSDGNPGLPPYAPGYTPDTDRTLIGPLAWNLGPPNGRQRVDDILNQVKQYFHDCA